jgi:hypothetical protein
VRLALPQNLLGDAAAQHGQGTKDLPGTQGVRKAGAIRALANALDYAALLRFMHKALAARAELDSVIGRFAPGTPRFRRVSWGRLSGRNT